MNPLVVWLRQDLRLADNPALFAAASEAPVVLLYLWDTSIPVSQQCGGAQRWWLHHSLQALQHQCQQRNFFLVLRRGDPVQLLPRLLAQLQAQGVYWNRLYDPFHVVRDSKLKVMLRQEGFKVATFNGSLLMEPWQVKPVSGPYFKVFTPFWRACRSSLYRPPLLPIPSKQDLVPLPIQSELLAEWQLLPRLSWAKEFDSVWQPGEEGAHARLQQFFSEAAAVYSTERDYPAKPGTSRLSPHLHFGEISPTQIYSAQQHAVALGEISVAAGDKFLSELGWREFCYHLLFHVPSLLMQPFRQEFARFAWQPNLQYLTAWQQGKTGYPIVDAGMRQLWRLGWMHNRVRMIVASFLTKHLLQDWQQGAAWFWDTLVDADLANNAAGWQWVAGSGVDAAPYFRIFNPTLQGEKFDPEGNYIRYFIPELARLPNNYIHRPWEAPLNVLSQGGVKLGQTYPVPVVDHRAARALALAKYKQISSKSMD